MTNIRETDLAIRRTSMNHDVEHYKKFEYKIGNHRGLLLNLNLSSACGLMLRQRQALPYSGASKLAACRNKPVGMNS
jgi:hypothetical protein